MKLSSKLAHDRRAWSVSVHDVVKSIGDADSTYPERMATSTSKLRRATICISALRTFPLSLFDLPLRLFIDRRKQTYQSNKAGNQA